MVGEYQLKARVTNRNVLRADVCIQVVRLVTSVRAIRNPSATVGAVSAECAGVWVCVVPVSAVVANPVVRVALVAHIARRPPGVSLGSQILTKKASLAVRKLCQWVYASLTSQVSSHMPEQDSSTTSSDHP